MDIKFFLSLPIYVNPQQFVQIDHNLEKVLLFTLTYQIIAVLEDLIAALTSSRLIKDLMKPQNTYSHEAVREVIETIANCSSMKLDSVSMNKLWDLIAMVFKWQVGTF